MKKVRSIVAIVLLFALCLQCVPSHAEQASVMSRNVNSATIGLSFSGGYAICEACVIGRRGVTSISGALLLKKGSTVVKNWKVGTLTDILVVDRTAAVSKGTYTLTLNVNAFLDGIPETVNISRTVTYNQLTVGHSVSFK